jgi:transcriptional regulator with XRE-family HTH domain
MELSQESVAHSAGISTRYYADIEAGKRKISVEVANKIAGGLGLRLQDLLDLADELKNS